MSTTATAPSSQTAPKPQTQPQAQAQPDPHLISLFQKEDSVASKSFAEICKYIKGKREHISDAVIRVSLMVPKAEGGRGLTEQSANVTLTYIKNLIDPQHTKVLEDLDSGKITVSEARELTKKKRKTPEKKQESASDPYAAKLTSVAHAAVNHDPVISKETFQKDLLEAYDDAVKTKAELQAAKDKKAKGDIGQGTGSPAPALQQQQSVPAPANGKAKKAA